MTAVSVQRHRNILSYVPHTVNVFGVTARNVSDGHHPLATASQIGVAGLCTIIAPIVIDLLLLACDADNHAPSLMVVWGRSAVRQPRKHKNRKVVVRLFVQQMDPKALL